MQKKACPPLRLRKTRRDGMTDWAKEQELDKKTDRLYNYLRAKYIDAEDSYNLSMLSRSEIKNKIRNGASNIHGVDVGSGQRLGVDVYDYNFQLDWERNNYD